MVHTDTIALETQGFSDVLDITPGVEGILSESGLNEGSITIFCKGSTGTVSTIEFEPGVVGDFKRTIERIVPESDHYDHNERWGDGNGFSHVRAALMKPSITVPFIEGRMALGTWQQIVFIDFDNRPRAREVIVQVMGQ